MLIYYLTLKNGLAPGLFLKKISPLKENYRRDEILLGAQDKSEHPFNVEDTVPTNLGQRDKITYFEIHVDFENRKNAAVFL